MTGNSMDRLADTNAEDEFYAHNMQLSNNDLFDKETNIAVEDHVDIFDRDFNESEHKEEGAGGEASTEEGRGRAKKKTVIVPKTDNVGFTPRFTRVDSFGSAPPVVVLMVPRIVPAAPALVARQPPQRRNRAVLSATKRCFVHSRTSKRVAAATEKATPAASLPPFPAKPRHKAARTTRVPSSSSKAALASCIYQEDVLLDSLRETKPVNTIDILMQRREMVARKKSKVKKSGWRREGIGYTCRFLSSHMGMSFLLFPNSDDVQKFTAGKKWGRRKGEGEGGVCVFTGKKARYRDPFSGFPYYNAVSYRKNRTRVESDSEIWTTAGKTTQKGRRQRQASQEINGKR